MDKWPLPVSSMTQHEILEFVQDPVWQSFRRSLKGLPTQQKLHKLQYWLIQHNWAGRRTIVQVDNYINALKRGGQLDMDLNVVR